ncbi:intradiol ring-cleavage dioxygenase [Microbacterium sp. cf332]|uniref:intradiol ring-cleavage dioxygenase n=1 Tax=Microbacterium sp. cf332 TaxID=1761804 RepID=UPI000884DE8D|nr:intradiol ring-cleavage dioxygenase [Microbacterium sp. cf332]SDQ51942.1 Dioxygenase [Microbacterium sp. cf332]
MTRIPEPDQTPDGPAYEGRLLDRADDEIVDQGASFDIRTLLTRRSVLSLAGIGLGAAALAACTPRSTASPSTSPSGTPTTSPSAIATPDAGSSAGAIELPAGEIPDETAGPYPGDGSNGPDILEQSGIVRGDIRSSLAGGATAEGVPMSLRLTVLDAAGGDIPFVGAAIYVWHCDSAGGYSMYSSGIENENYLRGVQIADSSGAVTFTSIVPACYSGRWPHIHFEVYPDANSITDAANAIATSQVALPQDVCESVYALPAYDGSTRNLSQVTLNSDNVFGDDGGALQLATVTGDAASGYTVSLIARVDTRTAPTAAAAPGGGSPGRP